MSDRSTRYDVASWMTDTPIAVAPQVSVRTAFFKMRAEGYRHLLVVRDGGLVGIVTDRDLRRPDVSDDPEGWKDLYQLDEDVRVEQVMTRDVHCVRPETPLAEVVDTFLERKFGAVPVLDDKHRLVGILTQHDLLSATRALLAEQAI